MKKALGVIWTSFIILILFIAAITFYKRSLEPVSVGDNSTIFTVEKGSTLDEVAQGLKEKNLIRSRLAFRLLTLFKGKEREIKAGKYILSPSMSSAEILETLVEGREIRYVITIPEGKNMYDVARLLEEAGLFPRSDFLKEAKNKKLLKSLGVPGDTVEGFLFPDTYFVSVGLSAKEVIEIFVKRFWQVWKENGFDEKIKKTDLGMKEVVILASIVEKEALLPKERPLIASVFLNRLKKGMRLQADPTVRYGLLVDKGIYPRRLRTRHLRYKSPYNTYIIKGLPKGPICNPGVQSIRAVLEPVKSDYLYFVSMNNGAHKFSKTLEEHNRAVYRYQIKKLRPK